MLYISLNGALKKVESTFDKFDFLKSMVDSVSNTETIDARITYSEKRECYILVSVSRSGDMYTVSIKYSEYGKFSYIYTIESDYANALSMFTQISEPVDWLMWQWMNGSRQPKPITRQWLSAQIMYNKTIGGKSSEILRYILRTEEFANAYKENQ